MAFTLRQQKELELDIHNQLYTNILILTTEYPATKEFDACFKSDMFVKSNKLAFQHAVHYLLNILNAEQFKQKITWPILNARMETQFRNEVMKYLNDINSVNKDTGIPLIMTSHLISPGGYKFAEFMFRLSQFVLSEHIKRDPNLSDFVTYPPKADTDFVISSQQVKIYDKIIDDQYYELTKKHIEFNTKYDKAKMKAVHIMQNYPIIEKNTIENVREMNALIEAIPEHTTELSGAEREVIVNKKLEELAKMILHFKECSELIDVLNKTSETNSCLERNCKVELIEYFKSFLETIKRNKSIIKERKDHNLSDHLKITAQIFDDLSLCNSKYQELESNLQIYCAQLKKVIQNYLYDETHRNEELSKKIQETFARIPTININIRN